MSQRRKCLGLAEEEMNGQKTGEAKSGSSTSEAVSRPIETLVFETAIPLFKDVRLLKVCRLVCKEWNSLACPRLRAISKTTVREDAEESQLSCLRSFVENRNSGLPSVFRDFHVSATSFRDDTFWSFVQFIMQQQDIFISELTVNYPVYSRNQRRLESFLLSNRKNEKLIRMKFYGRLIAIQEVFPYDQIRFPHLKQLHWRYPGDFGNFGPDLLFFQKMLLYSPLEIVSLEIAEGLEFKQFFRSGTVGNIQKLNLSCDEVSLEDWVHLSQLMLPKVRELVFEIRDRGDARSDPHRSVYAAMISNGAESLESLGGTCIPFELLPTFPKLRKIQCLAWGRENKFRDVTAERFPSLKSISFRIEPDSCRFEEVVSPHFGVERIELTTVYRYQDLLHRALRCMSSQFPNAVELKLKSNSKLKSSLLATMHACFPNLKVLDLLEIEADFETLSGYQVDVDDWLESGFPIELAPLQGSLPSFKELEMVILGEKIPVSESLLKYCLSRVSKLKFLTVKWDENSSPQTLDDYERHASIALWGRSSFEKKTSKEKDRIYGMLPGVIINEL